MKSASHIRFLVSCIASAWWCTALFAFAHGSDLGEIKRLIEQNEYQQALEIVHALEGQERDDQDHIILAKGNVLLKLGRTEEAERVFEESVDKYPRSVGAYNNLAVIYAGRGNLMGARDILEKAAVVAPEYKKGLHNLASIHFALACRVINMMQDPALGSSLPLFKVCKQQQRLGVEYKQPSASGQVSTASKPDSVGTKETAPDAEKVTALIAPSQPAVTGDKHAAQELTPEMINEIKAVVENWEQSWEKRDLERHFELYALDLVRSDDQAVERWKAKRQQAVNEPEWIVITISGLKTEGSQAMAVARFRQYITSSDSAGIMRRELKLQRINRLWKIVGDTTI